MLHGGQQRNTSARIIHLFSFYQMLLKKHKGMSVIVSVSPLLTLINTKNFKELLHSKVKQI